MDKQDQLAALVEGKLHDHGAKFEYGDGLELAAGDIAAAVRSFMGSRTETLEAALREIANDPYLHGQRIQRMKKIARTALGGDGE